MTQLPTTPLRRTMRLDLAVLLKALRYSSEGHEVTRYVTEICKICIRTLVVDLVLCNIHVSRVVGGVSKELDFVEVVP